MKKIAVIFGTRPEAIKMCPLIKRLKLEKEFETVVIVTGQHREMLDQVLNIFEIIPDIDMNIMSENQTLFSITVAILSKIENILTQEKPDVVLVHGDTTTAYAVALACFYKKIDVGHVEAGLRTFNMDSPYPEEFNRQSISLISKYNFAPTKQAYDNLIRQKVLGKVWITGNTVIDALKTTVKDNYYNEELEWASDSRLIFLTAHRRENIGVKIDGIFNAIKKIAMEYKDVKIIYPVHMNPKLRETAYNMLDGIKNIHLINPVDFVTCHNIMAHSYLIMTDSGGIQEEAPSLRKPVLVLRDTTERPEGIEAGVAKIVGTDEINIFNTVKKLLDNNIEYEKMVAEKNPYGTGCASEKIVGILKQELK